jgi:hypothetical protein
VRLLNQDPNGLLVQRSGRSHLTVIRTHIFLNHLLSSVYADDRLLADDRQPLFCFSNPTAADEHCPWVFNPKKVAEFAIVFDVMNHEIRDLSCLQ